MDTQEASIELKTYLTFYLDDEVFAVNVGKVLSIMEIPRITQLPKSPDYLKGVINLRGEALPVIDLRFIFGLDKTEYTKHSNIIVLSLTIENISIKLGVIVDSVKEVREIEDKDIQPPVSLKSNYQHDFIRGMTKVDDTFIMMVDMERVINTEQMEEIEHSSSEALIEENSEV